MKTTRNYDSYVVYLEKVLDDNKLLYNYKVFNNCIIEVCNISLLCTLAQYQHHISAYYRRTSKRARRVVSCDNQLQPGHRNVITQTIVKILKD